MPSVLDADAGRSLLVQSELVELFGGQRFQDLDGEFRDHPGLDLDLALHGLGPDLLELKVS